MTPNASVPRPAQEPPGGRVWGRVRRRDGGAVPHAAVTLVDPTGRRRDGGTADGEGRYALSAPDTGPYVLIAAAEGHEPRALAVTAGDGPLELHLVPVGGGRLTGAVLGAGGRPVPDATVTVTDGTGEVVGSARSGAEGRYTVDDLTAGEYTLAAHAPSCRPAAVPVSVRAGRETRQDIELSAGRLLRGTVRAPGGRPVDEARVTLLDRAGNVAGTTMTTADGLFRFADVAPGDHTVVAAGYPPAATVLKVTEGSCTERDLRLGHED